MAAANRRFYVSAAVAFALFLLLVLPVFLIRPLGSPATMVQAQVVRGEKIATAPMPPVPNRDANALAVLSNAISAAAVPRPKLIAADSNSLPEIIKVDGVNYLNLSFARLSSFPFKVTPEMADATGNPEAASRLAREQVPDTVKAFTEKPAAVTGFMLPVRMTGEGASDFMLLRNQSACCYGVMPRVNEWVIVHTKGRAVKPVLDVPVTAIGMFHVGEMREDGHLVGIYYLECDQLLPIKQVEKL